MRICHGSGTLPGYINVQALIDVVHLNDENHGQPVYYFRGVEHTLPPPVLGRRIGRRRRIVHNVRAEGMTLA